MFTTNEILDMAIRLEKNGETVYRNASKRALNTTLASTLKWMADEEVKHADWFKRLKKNNPSLDENSLAQEMSSQLLKGMISEQRFSLNGIDFSKTTSVNQLIMVFIEFEKDTILFYEMLESFIQDNETRKRLKEIIAEEDKHVVQLQDLMRHGK